MTQPDPNAQSGNPEGQSAGQGTGTDGTGTGTGTGTDGQSAGTNTGQQTPPEATVSRAEYEALQNRLRAADQNRQRVEDELKQIRDKDMPALDKAQRDLAEATRERDEAREALKQARLENAFVTDNKYKWKNPKTALKLADLSKVEVDDDGTVRNLTAALDALAKAEPYLLEDTNSSGGDGDGSGSTRGSTGASGNGGRAPETKVDLSKLASRVPALRSRGIGVNKQS